MLLCAALLFGLLAAPADAAAKCISSNMCEYDNATGIYSLSTFITPGGTRLTGMAEADEREWFYGNFSVKFRFPYGNSRGVTVAFYLTDTRTSSNKDLNHGEIDVEVYGGWNSSNLFYTTNVFTGGKQNLVQMTFPWDGASQWHTYAVQWNQAFIMWSVDGKPFRILSHMAGEPWPAQPMKVLASVWDSSFYTKQYADYSKGPIAVQFKDFQVTGCPDESLEPAPGSCPTWRGLDVPWNKPPSVEDAQYLLGLQERTLVGEWGWDAA